MIPIQVAGTSLLDKPTGEIHNSEQISSDQPEHTYVQLILD
jgi:hypothetical protein